MLLEEIWIIALKWARRIWNDDEAESVATEAVMDFYDKWTPALGVSLKTFLYRKVQTRVLRAKAKLHREKTNVDVDTAREVPADAHEFLPDHLLEVAFLRYDLGLPKSVVAGRLRISREALNLLLKEVEDAARKTA